MYRTLSFMMFLQYAAPGFVIPLLSHYLKNYLHFSPSQVGWVLAIPALTGIAGQLVSSRIVDRLISAERLLAICHVLSGILMAGLFFQHDFSTFMLLYGLYGFCFIPTFGLTNTVAFHNLKDARREFGKIRMWGPVSWALVGVLFSMLWLRSPDPAITAERVPQALFLSALTSIGIGIYALFLPKTGGAGGATVLVPGSLRILFRRKDIRFLSGLTLLNTITHQFYYYAMGPYLSQIGLPDDWMLPVMGLGQAGEIVVLALLGRFLPATGFKLALALGIASQMLRFLLFAQGNLWLSMAAIPLHGLCYGCYFSVAFIYLDTHCAPGNRGGAQQLFNILILGLGNLLGSIIAGEIAGRLVQPDTGLIDYQRFWWITLAASATLLISLVLFFRELPPSESETKPS